MARAATLAGGKQAHQRSSAGAHRSFLPFSPVALVHCFSTGDAAATVLHSSGALEAHTAERPFRSFPRN
jgi:hypothetical protein